MSDSLYWYASIFAWLFFTGIGLPPVPEEAGILYAAGLQKIYPEVWWPFAWLACGLGIVCADLALYGIGRWWGPTLFEYRWVQKFLKKERRQRLENRFHQHGIKLLILARFLPPLRTGVFLIAGASRYSLVKFLIADLIYVVFGVGLFFFFGTWVIEAIDQVRQWAGHWAMYLLAVPLIGYGLYRYYRYLKRRELAGEPATIIEAAAGAGPEGAAAPAAAPAAMREAKEMLKE